MGFLHRNPLSCQPLKCSSILQSNGDGFHHYFHRNGPHHSAMCIFSLTDIHNVFQTSKFRGTASSGSMWQAKGDSDPDPRPGFDVSLK